MIKRINKYMSSIFLFVMLDSSGVFPDGEIYLYFKHKRHEKINFNNNNNHSFNILQKR